MKERLIFCPECSSRGRKSPLLGKAEDVKGTGVLKLWCKRCRREVKVSIETLSGLGRG